MELARVSLAGYATWRVALIKEPCNAKSKVPLKVGGREEALYLTGGGRKLLCPDGALSALVT